MATIGDNRPDSRSIREQEFARMREAYRDIDKRRDALLASAAKLNVEITHDDQATLLADGGKQIRDTISLWDGWRKTEKEPHLERGRGVDSFFKSCIEPLEEALKPLRLRLAAWNQLQERQERERREEAERAARQEAEKLAAEMASDIDLLAAVRAEEEAKAAAALAAQQVPMQVRGGYGGIASGRKVWKCQTFDRGKIDLEALRSYLDDECLIKAVRKFVAAGGRELRGASIVETVETQFR